MAKRTITALFDDYEDAAEAVSRLEAAGIPNSDISIVASNSDNRHGTASSSDPALRDTADDAADGAGTGATLGTLVGGGAGLLAGLGLLAIPGLGPVVAAGWLVTTALGAGIGAAAGGLVGSLTGAGVSEADAHLYAEGVRRGGTLVTVRAEAEDVDRVSDILDDEGTVDLDERETAWRSEGWTAPAATGASTTAARGGAYGTTGTTTAGEMGAGSTGLSPGSTADYGRSDTARPVSTPGLGATGRSGTSERDEAIPIVEEELNVGKRAVEGGRVRVRSYMVETPVEEQVSLREENVSVERRPVDRPLTGADAAFKDRTIEATEKREEAVVSKDARVKEELVVKKDVENRTETVSDTVRRTEVEVDDERSTGRTTGSDFKKRT